MSTLFILACQHYTTPRLSFVQVLSVCKPRAMELQQTLAQRRRLGHAAFSRADLHTDSDGHKILTQAKGRKTYVHCHDGSVLLER